MKLKMIGGIREADHRDPLGGLWLQVVAFPMSVTNYDALEPSDPEEITVHDEDELRVWAERAFDEIGYEIFDLEAPADASASPGLAGEHPLLDLISRKKAEYERLASASEPARGQGMIARITLWLARPLLARLLSQRMVHYTKMSLYWEALREANLLSPLHEDSAFACSRGDAAIRSLAFYELQLPWHMLPDYPRTRREAKAVLHREQRESYITNSRIVAERQAGVAGPRAEDPEDRLRASEAQRGLLEAEAVMAYLDRMKTDD